MLLQAQDIHKRFGAVQALNGAHLEVAAGEVHVLLGENGAGKSTLMRIFTGMCQPDSGTLLWRGEPVTFRTPKEASARGIAMVHQESLLMPHLTVAENIYLGHESAWVNRRGIVEKAERLLESNGFRLSAQARVSTLTPAGKQLVEICRAVAHGSSLLIFDEPTSSLSETETAEVFRIIRSLCERQMAIVYITHRMEELRELGQRVTVFRDGATVHTGPLASVTREELLAFMAGRRVEEFFRREPLPKGPELLRVDRVSRGMLRDVSFTAHAGEVVGIAGLVGAGRTEMFRLLFGLDRADAGSVTVAGRVLRRAHPREAIEAGVALVPEDRQRHGVLLRLPVAANITLPDMARVSRFGWLRKRREYRMADDFRTRLRVRCHSVRQKAGSLSGGNQQKVAIAKWVARNARVFLFDEPTRGIDVSAKQEVFEEIDRLARGGAAVLMISSEWAELTQVTDRILVLCEGRLVQELPPDTSQPDILHWATPQGSSSDSRQDATAS